MNMAPRGGTDGQRVAVVGAGIVGLAAAWHLQREGAQVTLIDRDDPGLGCSFGNAGAISSTSVAPLAMPGAVRSAFGMMVDRDGPLYIPSTYLLRIAPWLLRFVKASRPEEVDRIATALTALLSSSTEHHHRLLREIGAIDLLNNEGQLHLYRDSSQLAKDEAGWALRRRHGLRAERLGRAELLALEPDIGDAYTLGMYIDDQSTCLNPYRYSLALAENFRRNGGRIVRDDIREIVVEGGSVTGVRGRNGAHPADNVAVCAGAWSARLLEPLGYRVPLETQRGYHIDVVDPGVSPRRAVIAADRKVFITPMETGLRAAGTVEFGGLERPPTARRAALLMKHLGEVFPKVRRRPVGNDYWMGNRPCLPDTLPVIGGTRRFRGLWFDFGHGHLGLTMAAVSGNLLSRMMLGRPVNMPTAPYSIDRYASRG